MVTPGRTPPVVSVITPVSVASCACPTAGIARMVRSAQPTMNGPIALDDMKPSVYERFGYQRTTKMCVDYTPAELALRAHHTVSAYSPREGHRMKLRTISTLAVALLAFLCADAQAQSRKVTEVRNVDYVPQAEYRDGKDRLDLYIPAGLT